MLSSPSLPGPRPGTSDLRPLWRVALAARPRGLVLAREKGWLLAWDEGNWLTLLDRRGERQAQWHGNGQLAGATASDDGSACAAVGQGGEVWWLTPDLMPRWQRTVSGPALAVALDPFGQYLAVADDRAVLHLFDRQGRQVARAESVRPLHHLAFVPEAPRLIAAADLGLVACFDPTGRCLWRDGLVAHVGSLAVSGDGARILLACFTDGLRGYSLDGKKQKRVALEEPCRLAAVTFDGRYTLAGGLGTRLYLLDRAGRVLATPVLEQPVVTLALSALGAVAVVALADGHVLGLDLRAALPA